MSIRICVFAAAMMLLCGATSAQEVQIVNIGFSSPLTGSQASAGKDNQDGVLLAIMRLNAQHIVIGNKRIQFALIAEDDQGDPRSGVGVAQKLVDAGVKAVIGPYNSGVTIPASRIYNDAGIISLTVASNPTITEQGFVHVYRVAASDKQLGGKMALYAVNELHIKTVAMIDDRTAYGQGLANEFAQVAKMHGVQVLSNDFTNDKATDFTAILTAIKSRKPDAIFLGGYAPQGGPIKRQMRQLGIHALLLGGDGICSPEMGRLAGTALTDDSVYCVQGGSLHNKLTTEKQFAEEYQAQFQRPPEVYAVSFYDGMMLVAHAMQQANSVEPQHYRQALQDMRYKGANGWYGFDSKRDMKESPVTIFTFKNRLPKALTTY